MNGYWLLSDGVASRSLKQNRAFHFQFLQPPELRLLKLVACRTGSPGHRQYRVWSSGSQTRWDEEPVVGACVAGGTWLGHQMNRRCWLLAAALVLFIAWSLRSTFCLILVAVGQLLYALFYTSTHSECRLAIFAYLNPSPLGHSTKTLQRQCAVSIKTARVRCSYFNVYGMM